MPRPHALPHKLPPSDDPFPAFDPSPPPARPLAAVNAQRGDKAVFDALQAWFSFHEGRSLHQCETFALLLDVALRADDPRLRGFSEARASG